MYAARRIASDCDHVTIWPCKTHPLRRLKKPLSYFCRLLFMVSRRIRVLQLWWREARVQNSTAVISPHNCPKFIPNILTFPTLLWNCKWGVKGIDESSMPTRRLQWSNLGWLIIWICTYMVAIKLSCRATKLAPCQMDMKSSKFIAHTLNALKFKFIYFF